jgi:hypothetical protein
MKMFRKNLLVFTFVSIFMILVGCTTPVATPTPTQQIPIGFQTQAEVMAKNIINGLDQQDYAIFSKDFDQKMAASIPSSAMTEVHKLLWNQNGNFQSIKTSKILSDKGYLVGLYEVIFEKGKITMQVVYTPTEPYQVIGLWFPSN